MGILRFVRTHFGSSNLAVPVCRCTRKQLEEIAGRRVCAKRAEKKNKSPCVLKRETLQQFAAGGSVYTPELPQRVPRYHIPRFERLGILPSQT